MERYPDIRSRTLEWMTKLIDAVYKGKLSSDEQRGRAGQPPLPLLDHFFSHLTGVYGTRELVNQNMAQVMATLEEFRGVSRAGGAGGGAWPLTPTPPCTALCLFPPPPTFPPSPTLSPLSPYFSAPPFPPAG